jgi:hypothetical protein
VRYELDFKYYLLQIQYLKFNVLSRVEVALVTGFCIGYWFY